MSVRIVPFQTFHLGMLSVQPKQKRALLPADVYAEAGAGWTAFDGTGRVILCAGLAWVGPGYAHAWAVMCDSKGADFVAITRATRRIIAAAGYRRLELFVDAGDAAALKWALLLGFEREGVKRAALKDGGDMIVMSIIDRGAKCQQAA